MTSSHGTSDTQSSRETRQSKTLMGASVDKLDDLYCPVSPLCVHVFARLSFQQLLQKYATISNPSGLH